LLKEREEKIIIDVFTHHVSVRVAEYLEKALASGKGRKVQYPPQNAKPEVQIALTGS
jgi:hypothetical protein